MPDVTSPFAFPYPQDTDLVRDGATDIENLAEGVNDYLAGGYLYAGTRYYTSSGTFEKADPLGTGDIGLRAIRVRCVGAGGGGGGCTTTSAAEVSIAAAGGGGSYSESLISDITGLDTSVTVTRGAGGTFGAAGNNSGSAGGQSSFGSAVTAPGGGGGLGGAGFTIYTRAGGAGGSVGTGDLAIRGSAAQTAFALTLTQVLQASGGTSFLSGTNSPANIAVGADGAGGVAHGGGGQGGANAANQGTARVGGNGANGIVIIDCFV